LETFKLANCFPFCLAARAKGSRSNGLILHSAADWQNFVQFNSRDCSSKFLSDSDEVLFSTSADLSTKQLVLDSNALLPGNVELLTWDASTHECVYSDTKSTRVDKKAVSELQRYDSLLMPSQPFAVAGEVALTTVTVTSDSGATHQAIKVQRLYGVENAQAFTLVTVNSELPANEPCIMLDDCPADSAGRISIPYAYTESPARHNPAVATQWGVFFCSQPVSFHVRGVLSQMSRSLVNADADISDFVVRRHSHMAGGRVRVPRPAVATEAGAIVW
jgi:hypothetical protein